MTRNRIFYGEGLYGDYEKIEDNWRHPTHSGIQPPGFPFPRRSRSPLQREPKARSFSPGKRKLSPKRERERERDRSREQDRERSSRPIIPPPRKRTRSKSPETAVSSSREGGHMGSYAGNVVGPPEVSPGRSYQGPSCPYPQGGSGPDGDHPNRPMVSLSERFHGSGGPGSYKKEPSDHPVFRGPEGTGFDVNELKKITVDIRRNLPVDMVPIERNIINPEDVVLVRRPATEDNAYHYKGERKLIEFSKDGRTMDEPDSKACLGLITAEWPNMAPTT
ncbi:hypothetical protein ANN_09579 [Periplaneta americana]|uniref:Complementary sex determination N-terminal domain-containing protein n=1 Tax=Periplaneta americana TaxID=6978 RepID=A0ABQ8TPA7_PERAM|nr:hypothetical protein ANN_09579 [Periplaneta americana]